MSDEPFLQISDQDKLDLKKIMDNTENYEDNTEIIKMLKHSSKIKNDVLFIEKEKEKVERKQQRTDNFQQYSSDMSLLCPFLYEHYNEIFQKLLKNEINVAIIMQLLNVLEMIEEGKLEQQHGSIVVGKILQKLFLDSAVRHADNLDKEHANEKDVLNEGIQINWKTFKQSLSSSSFEPVEPKPSSSSSSSSKNNNNNKNKKKKNKKK